MSTSSQPSDSDQSTAESQRRKSAWGMSPPAQRPEMDTHVAGRLQHCYPADAMWLADCSTVILPMHLPFQCILCLIGYMYE